jgi:ATPase subunit of ABC transporter with duplicated ATPase domains
MEYKIKNNNYKKKIKMMNIMLEEIITSKINEKNTKMKNIFNGLFFLTNEDTKQTIFITGLYGVGKTTFIKYLEKHIHTTNKTTILCELSYQDIFEYNRDNKDNNIYIIHLVPENTESYKSKLINKLLEDYKTGNNTLINYLKTLNLDVEENNIDLYKVFNKKTILSDKNFNFLDPVINFLYKKILSKNDEQLINYGISNNIIIYKILF